MMLTELEKITINMGPVDLEQIDLLVQDGFYQNRTDLIRTASRIQLTNHAEAVNRRWSVTSWCSGCNTTPRVT